MRYGERDESSRHGDRGEAARIRRRRELFRRLDDAVMVLQAAPVALRSRDTERPYRPDSELYYVTGAIEPETVAVLAGGSEPRFTLFVRERDPEAELWTGRRLGVESAAERFGAHETLPLSALSTRLPVLLHETRRVFFRLGRGDAVERLVTEALTWARTRGARAGAGPRTLVDPGEILDDMRLVKDAHEIDLLRRAAALSAEGHRAAMGAVRPGMREWEIEALVDYTFRRGGAAGPGYETIVGSGANACVLHYVENQGVIGEEDLVLLDAGAELGLYNGDITRTFPAAGRFTEAQRAVYAWVDAAREAAMDAVRPGATTWEVHRAAVEVLTRGLVDLGVLQGDREALLEEEAYKPFFPHQTSHWLGLDVHDPGDYARDGKPRELVPGMVLTVEPGLYFGVDVPDPAGRYAGVGVRVEDDVLVTPDGHENLTAAVATDMESVEAMVQGR